MALDSVLGWWRKLPYVIVCVFLLSSTAAAYDYAGFDVLLKDVKNLLGGSPPNNPAPTVNPDQAAQVQPVVSAATISTDTTLPPSGDVKTNSKTAPDAAASADAAGTQTMAAAAATTPYTPVSFKSIKPMTETKPDGYYQTGLFTGAAIYTYDIPVMPGTAGLAPSLTLSYNSQDVLRGGWVGSGWSLSDNYVQRNVNGTVNSEADDEYSMYLSGARYDLKYVAADGRYHTQPESYLYIEKKSGGSNDQGSYWLVRSKDGVSYRFGYTSNSELVRRFPSKPYQQNQTKGVVGDWGSAAPGGGCKVVRFDAGNGNWIMAVTITGQYCAAAGGCAFRYTSINMSQGDMVVCGYPEYGGKNCGPAVCHASASFNFQINIPNSTTTPVAVRWSLDDAADTHGNHIYYSYNESAGSLDNGTTYLSKIEYDTDRKRTIDFALEDNPNPRGVYENGAYVRMSKRLREISEKYNSALVRKVRFGYVQNGVKTVTMLKSLESCGSDGVTCQPKTEFTYNPAVAGWGASYATPPCGLGTDDGCRFANLNGDALIDIISANPSGGKGYLSYLNNGAGWVLDSRWYLPSSVNFMGDTAWGVVDLNGDGKDDLLNLTAAYLNTESGWVKSTKWAGVCDFASANQCRFVDLNGDGLVDALKTVGNERQAWINTGSKFTRNPSWAPDVGVVFNSSETYGVVDYNGDGYVDILGPQRIINTGTSLVWLGLDGRWQNPCSFKAADVCRYVDLNSDGLVDILQAGTTQHAWLNNGTGWGLNESWNASGIDIGQNGNTLDVNGDGLPDLNARVKSGMAPYALREVKNTFGGRTQVAYRAAENFNPNANEDKINYPLWCVASASEWNGMGGAQGVNSTTTYYYSGGLHDYGDREFRGFNNVTVTRADGTKSVTMFHQDDARKGMTYDQYDTNALDVKYSETKNTILQYNVNGIYTPQLMRKEEYIYDGFDNPKTTAVEYGYDVYGNVLNTTYLGDTSAQNDEVYVYNEYALGPTTTTTTIPQNWWNESGYIYNPTVFSRADWDEPNINMGRGGCYFDDGCSCVDNCIRMGGDAWDVDGGSVSKTLDLTNYYAVNIRFSVGLQDACSGKNPYIQLYVDNTLFETIYKSNCSDNNMWSAEWFGPYNLTQYARGVHKIKFMFFSGGCDCGCGSIIPQIQIRGAECFKDTDCSSPDQICIQDFKCFSTLSSPKDWVPINDRVKHTLTLNSRGEKASESFYAYDGQQYGAAPTKGDLTGREDWLSTGGNPVTAFGYDSYGNQVNVTDPLGRVSRTVYGLTDTTYTYPEQSINALGHTTTYSYDFGTGNVLSVTDPNGYVTSYKYDVFGRKVKDILPYDSESSPTAEYQYYLDGVAPEYVKVLRKTGDVPLAALEYYDGLGRIIQAKRDAEDPAKQIVTDVYYDNVGRVGRQSVPYLASSSDSYTTPSPVLSTRVGYDPLGRVVNITNTDGSVKRQTFDRWTITAYDENGHYKDYVLDGYGRVILVKEHNLGDIYTTTYGYDPLDDLVNITDEKGNIFRFSFDSLGRKTGMVDPDLGTWTYEYDAAGNLVAQTDGRGVQTTLEYDDLNRVEVKTYSDGVVEYSYDAVKGTLSSVSDSGGTTAYSYDQRLRRTAQTRLMDGISWTAGWTYDSADRVLAETTPNGKVLTSSYNRQGEVDSVAGIVSNVDYNALNKVTLKDYGAAAQTLSYYDTDQRLRSITAPGKQNLTYAYDPAGNVLSVSDGMSNISQAFSYDGLDRLVGAEAPGAYNHTYSYDSIGNVLWTAEGNCTSVYLYGVLPHAVSSVEYSGICGGVLG